MLLFETVNMAVARIVTLVALAIMGFVLCWSEFRTVPAHMRRLDEAFHRGTFFGPMHVVRDSGKRLYEPELDIFFPDTTARFKRNVQYCQWTERRIHHSNSEYVSASCRGGVHCRSLYDPISCGAQPGCYFDLGGDYGPNRAHYSYTVQWMASPVNSDMFHSHQMGFNNPRVTERVEEVEVNAEVEFENGLLTNAKHLTGVLSSSQYHFKPEDYESLKQSSAYAKGFIFMDQNYVTLDYSRISSEHEFFKNLNRFSNYMQSGHIDFAGPSLCTPGDIRLSYTLSEIPFGDSVSIVATKRGGSIVPIESHVHEGETLYYSRTGEKAPTKRVLLDLEAQDVFWWQVFWRLLFAGIMTPFTVVMVVTEYRQLVVDQAAEEEEKKEAEAEAEAKAKGEKRETKKSQ